MDQTAPAEDAGKASEETAEQPAPKRTARRRKTGTGSTASRTRKKQAEETPAEVAAPAEQPAEEVLAEAAAPAEKAEEPAQKKPRKKRGKHRYAAPVGGAYILLALIGVIAVIYGAVQL